VPLFLLLASSKRLFCALCRILSNRTDYSWAWAFLTVLGVFLSILA
jgi:hypothetical protein